MKRTQTNDIAIIGMGCRYPDANNPEEFWTNMLAQRRAFRRFPEERLRLEDYYSPDKSKPEHTYSTEAAVLEGFEFDRVKFRVAGNTYRAADITHWLALQVATDALADAGFPDGEGLPRSRTGVILGNTLTGEFSRANIMRLRWPYVRRTLEAALHQDGMEPERMATLLARVEKSYKENFPEISEESLAGGLSNTIAGRICNYFDLNGGGYTVDGACASSLLAVITACNSLVAGDIDTALAGGVDLSLDPFEIVGFAKTGALAEHEMRVYDARSAGFWPGEGCGFVVLKRYEDAVRDGNSVYAVIRGWGVSSDGSGGITRPEVEGQLQALRAAYNRAGYTAADVTFFEGHGTGTSLGDITELKVLSRARHEANPAAEAAYLASTKANIGHTKAAAGVAGLIKATMALRKQIIPPSANCDRPHAEINKDTPVLRIMQQGIVWPAERPLRAAVSAMGFGGINTHITLENPVAERRAALAEDEERAIRSAQDAELFLFGGADSASLSHLLREVQGFAARISRAEMADVAAALEAHLPEGAPVRAAVVAARPAELADGIASVLTWLEKGIREQIDVESGCMLGNGTERPAIGFLFPGQGSPAHLDGGIYRRRFTAIDELYKDSGLPTEGDGIATEIAQPAIVTASLAALHLLQHLGIEAVSGVGHSLGELTALHWAGAMEADALIRIAAARGEAMAQLGDPTGSMASLGAGKNKVLSLMNGHTAVIAGLNSSRQTVISGSRQVITDLVDQATTVGISAVQLPVSHAFHSPLVEAAVPVLREKLRTEKFRAAERRIVSTVTGSTLDAGADIAELLCRQVTQPVLFIDAIKHATEDVRLLIEVGPGKVLSGLVAETDIPAIPLDAGGKSLSGLLKAVGAAFALGTPIQRDILFKNRFTKPFALDWNPKFLVNNCELAPVSDGEHRALQAQAALAIEEESAALHNMETGDLSPLELLTGLIAERAELPPEAIKTSDRMLSDLHLNSITVSQLVVEAARGLGLTPPASPTNYADASVREIADALQELRDSGGGQSAGEIMQLPAGVASWVRCFTVEQVDTTIQAPPESAGEGAWKLSVPDNYPLGEQLQAYIGGAPAGNGVIVCMPPRATEGDIERLLDVIHEVLSNRKKMNFILVQHDAAAASVAKTLHLEAPEINVRILTIPENHQQAVEWIFAEAGAEGFAEVRYGANGRRTEARLRLIPPPAHNGRIALDAADVVLVSGGGKGITAECAMMLARESGAKLAIVGRSQVQSGSELAVNLERMQAAGIRFRYYSADIGDAEAVRSTLAHIERDLGPVRAVLHGAGANRPKLLPAMRMEDIRHTLGPKVQGLDNILAAVDGSTLKVLVSFSSIIARSGMNGEADYALANEWLSRRTEEFKARHPRCTCLSFEWSVWSGVGMGERLGAVDALLSKGITPISPEEGVGILRAMLANPPECVSLVVTGRYGDAPTLQFNKSDLPFQRFLERTRYYIPRVELIVETEISLETDPYLDEHVFKGERLLPAVVGLEAMAQAAMALLETERVPVFEQAVFNRPIVVSPRSPLTLRIAALAVDSATVDVVIRSEESDFQVDIFTVRCRFDDAAYSENIGEQAYETAPTDLSAVAINPLQDLYGGIFFHTGRFRRVRSYRKLRARECVAEISPVDTSGWYSRYLPQSLVLGNPAMRDAGIHAILACIPHATLLPTGIDRLTPHAGLANATVFVHARERLREGNLFIYDVTLCDSEGVILEEWQGLRLQLIAANPREIWTEALLGPYIERRVGELFGGRDIAAVLQRNGADTRRERSDKAIQEALGHNLLVLRNGNGKPEVPGAERQVSAAHADELTLAVAAQGPIGCDVENVVERNAATWRDMLGSERYQLAQVIARETGEDHNSAATRVWEAGECLSKAGVMLNAPLVLESTTADGWVLLASGSLTAATYVGAIREAGAKTAFAVLTSKNV